MVCETLFKPVVKFSSRSIAVTAMEYNVSDLTKSDALYFGLILLCFSSTTESVYSKKTSGLTICAEQSIIHKDCMDNGSS